MGEQRHFTELRVNRNRIAFTCILAATYRMHNTTETVTETEAAFSAGACAANNSVQVLAGCGLWDDERWWAKERQLTDDWRTDSKQSMSTMPAIFEQRCGHIAFFSCQMQWPLAPHQREWAMDVSLQLSPSNCGKQAIDQPTHTLAPRFLCALFKLYVCVCVAIFTSVTWFCMVFCFEQGQLSEISMQLERKERSLGTYWNTHCEMRSVERRQPLMCCL